MSNTDKIKSYQLFFKNVTQAKYYLRNIQDHVTSNSYIKECCRMQETAITKLVVEVAITFANEDFSDSVIEDSPDSVSDCATVQISQTKIGIPVFLTKDNIKTPFHSLSAAARWIADNFNENPDAVLTAIHRYLRGGNFNPVLHGNIPALSSQKPSINPILKPKRAVTLLKDGKTLPFNSLSDAAHFIISKHGGNFGSIVSNLRVQLIGKYKNTKPYLGYTVLKTSEE